MPSSAEALDMHQKIITELESQIAEMENLLRRHGLESSFSTISSQTKNKVPTDLLDHPNAILTEKLPEESPETKKILTKCTSIQRNLIFGDYHEDVIKLQEFLKDKGYFHHPHITNYFGPVTEKAVKDFQTTEGLVSSGTPQTTGYGRLGPRTRNLIAEKSCRL